MEQTKASPLGLRLRIALSLRQSSIWTRRSSCPPFDAISRRAHWTKETDTYHVEIHGSTLIPCGLYFEVVGESESGEPKSTKIELIPSIATSFNESFISLDLASSIVSNLSSSSNEVRGRLIHGKDVATEDLFTFPIRKAWSPGLGTMAWLIPVIVGVVVFLMLVVLIIVCVVCRRQKKEDEKVSEEEEEECTEKKKTQKTSQIHLFSNKWTNRQRPTHRLI
ncbi:hypothetical protein BLNAU_6106 [Blattamonas nauphoetae]|uniref:Uncharacterized protein n=1 Tax=Blattamonas nauphoetae TaxID=2049346 RepID=A0ABQ9Y527_9EUKA|nr:hypothetical protein BLNAU_6106 [Blattamonas nauphoetae]